MEPHQHLGPTQAPPASLTATLSTPLIPGNSSSVLRPLVLSFPEGNGKGIEPCATLGDGLLTLSVILLGTTRMAVDTESLSLFPVEQNSTIQMLHSLYLFALQGTFWLLPAWGNEQSYHKHSCTGFCVILRFHSSRVQIQEWECGDTLAGVWTFMRN